MAGEEEPKPQAASLWAELRATGAAWLYPSLFFSILSFTLVVPFLPDIQTNFFANRAAAAPLGAAALRCQDYGIGAEPTACRDAHSTATLWSSWSSFLSNSVIAVIALPLVGSLSDKYGRKPFLVLSQALVLLPLAFLAAYENLNFVPLYAFYFANAFSGTRFLVAVAFAYLADAVGPSSRTQAFGLVMACFSGAFLLGPVVGVMMSPRAAVAASAAIAAGNTAFTAAFVPESEAQRTVEGGVVGGAKPAGGVLGAIRILRRSPLYMRLTLVMMVVGMADEGLQNCLAQYLQIKLNFQSKDIVVLFVCLGVGGLIVQGVLLRPLKAALGDRNLLGMALGCSAVANLLLAGATRKGAVWVAVFVLALNEVAVPAIASLKSNNASGSEQGAVQGALYGGRSLAQGVGPLLYASVFAAFTREGSSLPYFPGAPLVLGAALAAVALAVVATITTEMDDGRGGAAGGGGAGSWEPLAGDDDGEEHVEVVEGHVTVAERRHPSIDHGISAAGGGVAVGGTGV